MSKDYTYEEIFQRNIGVISSEDQEKIRNSVIAIAGVGGDGGLIAETLARMGFGHIRLADPENFEVSNINRQNGSSFKTIDRNKAQVISEIIKAINPFCVVETFEKGVNEENIEDFVKDADIVIDESEYTTHKIATLIARSARKHKVPLITGLNVGFGVLVMAFTERSISFEKYFGLSESKTIEEIADDEVLIHKWCPWLPSYVDIDVFSDIRDNKVSVPGVSPSVALVSAVVSSEVALFLLGKRELIEIPRYLWVDLYHRRIKIRRASKIMFYLSSLIMLYKSKTKKRK